MHAYPYSLLTGRYCWRTRLKRGVLYGTDKALIDPQRLTLAKLLKGNGYATACIGQWHLGLNWILKDGKNLKDSDLTIRAENADLIDFTKPFTSGPTELGFDYFFGTASASTTDYLYTFIENDRTVEVPTEKWPGIQIAPEDYEKNAVGYRPGLATPGWKHEEVDLVFVRKSLAYLEKHAKEKQGQPFFLFHALSAPHDPWLPPGLTKGKTREGARGDMVAQADWAFGQILEALERLNLNDHTLLIFSSDNGPLPGLNHHKSSGPWRGYKSHIWEGGHRVPFIARWPGHIRSLTRSEEPICLTDLMATLAAIVDVKLPAGAGPDSYNILPALLGKKPNKPIREALVSHSWTGVLAIRQGRWKLIEGTQGSGGFATPRDGEPKPGAPGQLYNLAGDPGETNNLYHKKPDVVARLSSLLEKYKNQGYSRPGGRA